MRTWSEVLIICLYFGFGAAFYHIHEGWTVTEALYFQIVTVTTVGYGDLHPKSSVGKLITIFWSLVGLGYIGFLISDLAGKIGDRLEALEDSVGPHAQVDVVKKRKECLLKGFVAISSVLLAVAIGTCTMMYLEDWEFIDALYWCCISTLTIGYGDKSPQNQIAYAFSVVYLLISTVTVAGALGQICSLSAELQQEKKRFELIHQALDPAWFKEMDTRGNGDIEKWEFITSVLIKLGKVTHDDIQPWLDRFDELDADRSGSLHVDHLHRIMHPCRARYCPQPPAIQQEVPTLLPASYRGA